MITQNGQPGDEAIPHEHIAAVTEHIGDYPVLKAVKTPTADRLPPNTALVHLKYSGLCHSDLSLSLGTGTHRPIEPCISGHEGAGHIVALGPATGAGSSRKVGDRVGIKFIRDTCGTCEACLDGDEQDCEKPEISGITVEGTFQQYVVAPVAHLVPIPDNIDLVTACPLLCAGLTVYKALLNANLKPGDWVVIPGAGGGLGHLAVQYALAMCYRVVAIDTGEDKRKLLDGYGTHSWIDFSEHKDVSAAVIAAIGGKAKSAIVTAGSIAPYQQALSYLGPRSTLVCVGLPSASSGALMVSPSQLVVTSARIVGSSVGTRAELQRALNLVSMGKVKVQVEVRALRDIVNVYHELESGKVKGRLVFDLSQV